MSDSEKEKAYRLYKMIFGEVGKISYRLTGETLDIYKAAFQTARGENWEEGLLDEREQKEVRFARLYARDFAHGTDGHSRIMLIAKMAYILECYENVLECVLKDSGIAGQWDD